jgi:hypothetical protein
VSSPHRRADAQGCEYLASERSHRAGANLSPKATGSPSLPKDSSRAGDAYARIITKPKCGRRRGPLGAELCPSGHPREIDDGHAQPVATALILKTSARVT